MIQKWTTRIKCSPETVGNLPWNCFINPMSDRSEGRMTSIPPIWWIKKWPIWLVRQPVQELAEGTENRRKTFSYGWSAEISMQKSTWGDLRGVFLTSWREWEICLCVCPGLKKLPSTHFMRCQTCQYESQARLGFARELDLLSG